MMTNEELKKKIAQIIADYFCPQRNEHKNLWGDDRLCYSKMNFAERERVAECTDALIAAGIVDKSDYASMKETAVRYKAEVSKAGARVKEAEAEANRYEMLYKLQNRDMALAERKAYESEHRAAKAEKALQKFAENITCEDCPFFSDCSSSEKMKDSVHQNYCYAEYLRQAEKELEEERGNGKKEV